MSISTESACSSILVYDEMTDDDMYSHGWSIVSTQSKCGQRGCACRVDGMCNRGVFNHYMIEDAELSPMSPGNFNMGAGGRGNGGAEVPSDTSFPIVITPETVDAVGVEEVRCKRHVVGQAYRYYKFNTPATNKGITMVSVSTYGYKSTCFNMLCYLLDMPRLKAPGGCMAMGPPDGENCWVLARDVGLTRSLFLCLTNIGISPIVEDENIIEILLKEEGLDDNRARFSTSRLVWKNGGPNLLWNPEVTSGSMECEPNSYDVRAVKTALVTISVLLTPKSLYGGKNPTTKLVTYFVHNVCLSGEL
jgi:hypothetical protein